MILLLSGGSSNHVTPSLSLAITSGGMVYLGRINWVGSTQFHSPCPWDQLQLGTGVGCGVEGADFIRGVQVTEEVYLGFSELT